MSTSPPNLQYAGAPVQQPAKKGLAVAALVLGILAILGCLIPVLNVVSIVLGIVAIVLGIVAMRAASKGRAGGKGMALVGIILSVLAIIGAIIANVLFGAAVESISESVEQQEAADAAAAQQFPGATADDVVAQAGETVTVNDVAVTTTAIAPQSNSLGSFVCSSVTYVNNGADQATFNLFDWKLQDPAGAARTVGIFGDNDLQSGDLAPGGTVTGNVCFEGTGDAGQYVLLYEGSIFGTERGAWINTL
jgi:hypothetical protein